MAEITSRRKTDETAHVKLDEEEIKRRDRRNLIILLVGGVLIIIGMVALAQFLSGGRVNMFDWVGDLWNRWFGSSGGSPSGDPSPSP